MIPCPVCNRDADDLLFDLSFDEMEVGLIRNLNQYWVASDGICRGCVNTIRLSVQKLRDQFAKAKSGGNFREYHRYYLNRRESGQWHHVNAEIAKWRQRQIVDRVSGDAERDGHEAWALFDADEKLIAQGANVND